MILYPSGGEGFRFKGLRFATIRAPAGHGCPAAWLARYQPKQAALGLDLAVQAERAEQIC